FDAAGHELAFNDNASRFTNGSEVTLSVRAGQTYYIGVDGAGPQARSYNPLTGAGAGVAAASSLGDYQLALKVGPPPLPVPPVLVPPPVVSPAPVSGEVTDLVQIRLGRPQWDAHAHRQRQQVTLVNGGFAPLLGPLWVVVDNLGRKAKLH